MREAWGTHAEQHDPGEDRPAARPAKTTSSYDFLNSKRAVWCVMNGWEHPNWFAPEGAPQENQLSWRWAAKGEIVGEEVKAVREAAGLIEMTFMSKFELSGTGAADWLNRTLANKLLKIGHSNLSHLLTEDGALTLRNVTNERAGMTIVGPKARDILAELTEQNLHAPDFPWFGVRSATVGLASAVRMRRQFPVHSRAIYRS